MDLIWKYSKFNLQENCPNVFKYQAGLKNFYEVTTNMTIKLVNISVFIVFMNQAALSIYEGKNSKTN